MEQQNVLDVRGLSCPEPVLRTEKALKGKTGLTVLLDSPTARDNVKAFAEKQGFQAAITEDGGEYIMKLEK